MPAGDKTHAQCPSAKDLRIRIFLSYEKNTKFMESVIVLWGK
jgi:hypothetical protein